MKQEMMYFLKNVFANVPEEMITQALIYKDIHRI